MVKNAVIVPTGAKGGFFPKQLPDPATDREGWLTEGREAYKLFIASLLDVTDNIVREAETGAGQEVSAQNGTDETGQGAASSSRGDATPGAEGGASGSAETSGEAGDTVVHPENVVRRDGDDSYLVVAADKGTAAFSDTANAISLERGFWLGDCLLYTSPSPRDLSTSRMPSSA